MSMVFTLIGIFMLSYADSFLVILVSVSLFGLGSSIFHPQGSQVAQQASGGRNGLAQKYFPGRRQWWLCSRAIVCSPDSDSCRPEWCTLVCFRSPSFSRNTNFYREVARQTTEVVRNGVGHDGPQQRVIPVIRSMDLSLSSSF